MVSLTFDWKKFTILSIVVWSFVFGRNLSSVEAETTLTDEECLSQKGEWENICPHLLKSEATKFMLNLSPGTDPRLVREENGQIIGVFAEYFRDITCKMMNVNCQLSLINFARAMQQLKFGSLEGQATSYFRPYKDPIDPRAAYAYYPGYPDFPSWISVVVCALPGESPLNECVPGKGNRFGYSIGMGLPAGWQGTDIVAIGGVHYGVRNLEKILIYNRDDINGAIFSSLSQLESAIKAFQKKYENHSEALAKLNAMKVRTVGNFLKFYDLISKKAPNGAALAYRYQKLLYDKKALRKWIATNPQLKNKYSFLKLNEPFTTNFILHAIETRSEFPHPGILKIANMQKCILLGNEEKDCRTLHQ